MSGSYQGYEKNMTDEWIEINRGRAFKINQRHDTGLGTRFLILSSGFFSITTFCPSWFPVIASYSRSIFPFLKQ